MIIYLSARKHRKGASAIAAAVVVATRAEKHRALAALTSAALGLPGMQASAAVPIGQAEGNVHYGYYQESDDRIQAQVYQGDFIVPIADRVEFTFSLQRDTYSGATPAFSIPETLTNQPKYKQNADGTPAAEVTLTDVVSAASQGVTAAGLTVLGGLNAYKSFVDAHDPAQAEFSAGNPRPPSPPGPPTLPGPVALDFQEILFASYAGKPNLAPVAGGNCPGLGSSGCYYEGGMAVGIVNDTSNPGAHVHRNGGAANRLLGYHADSSGIYIRAVDGSAFSLNSLAFLAPLTPVNPGTGPNDVWEILGFNTAQNPTLDTAPTPATVVAQQTVANGFNGTLVLDPAFQNINAFWIHYRGYPQTPADGKDFAMELDNVALSGVAPSSEKTPEQIAWEQALDRYVGIAQFRAVIDSMAPTGTRTVQRFQPQPREMRTMPLFGAKYYMDEGVIALSGGFSEEPDFRSDFGSVNLSRELNDKHTTFSGGYNLTANNITRAGAGHGTHHESDPNHNPTDYPDLDETSVFHGFNAGISQVVSKNTLFQATANYTRQSGYLTNPYKLVYVRGEITAEEYYDLWQAPPGEVDWKAVTNLEVVGIELFRENRPDLRNQWSVSTGLGQYVPAIDASLHLDYRYYTDDWSIDSHTFELSMYQSLPRGITVTPSIRYYSQSEADFFAPYFLAPRADGFYSSDFRLSGFGALSAGVTLSKEFTKGIALEAGYEYYTHAGSLKLGGGSAGDYADFDYFLVHAGLNVDLSAPGFFDGGHSGHGAHGHHGGATPAGVMFGHMLDEAGDVMVGYRYMFSDQGGDMLHGSDAVGNQTLVDRACGDLQCSSRPTDMTMHMHMLELMYAPSDWLNLMLMPQFVEMEMSLESLPGALEEDEHGGGHSSNGLGDTVMAALIKPFARPGHQLTLGLGISAPTGEVDITLDGIDSATSLLQDYGMQTGSGTWDLIPSLTYTGQMGRWSWGGQVSGVKRLEDRNESGYALGDVLQTTAWAGYRPLDWVAASVRGVYTNQEEISGEFNRAHPTSAPVDFPFNYGGQFWDAGFGLNLSIPGGAFAGHSLSVEWLQPVAEEFNGFQLERNGSLHAAWSYVF